MQATHGVVDPIGLLEALYKLEQPRSAWFRGTLDAAGASLDRGVGVGMILYDVAGPRLRVDAIEVVNVAPPNRQVGVDAHNRPEWEDQIVKCYRNEVCGTLDEHVPDPAVRAVMREQYAPLGLRDQILINGANPSGLGCALYVFSAQEIRLTAPERELLTRIAAHLSTAYRLLRRLEQPLPVPGKPIIGAVLNARGGVEHAEPDARAPESLRKLSSAVLRREWARTRDGRSSPERATAAWQPLVTGRWSLVDCYERDGRRYITACENASAPVGLDVLTSRERQIASSASLGRSNKEIAYELGLSHSTVRVLLARAAAKLGVRTRSALIAQVRSVV